MVLAESWIAVRLPCAPPPADGRAEAELADTLAHRKDTQKGFTPDASLEETVELNRYAVGGRS